VPGGRSRPQGCPWITLCRAGIGKSALVRSAVAEARDADLPGVLLPFLDGLRVREPSTNPQWNTIRLAVADLA